MPDPLDGVLGTIGIEVETELLPSHFAAFGWSNTHDASIEMPVLTLKNVRAHLVRTPENIAISGMMEIAGGEVLGSEFVSNVLFDEEEANQNLTNLLRQIQQFGERAENQRAGFHVHIGWAYDLNILKRTILISSWLESLLFHLGGMGYEFRGVTNNSAYCRPFTLFGPPIAESNLGEVQIMNIEALLSADNIINFWNRYGGTNFHNPPRRYTPQRYMGVNLFSIFLHKTLEFRMFNTSLNKEYYLAMVRLCREITRLTMSSEPIPDEINSVYEVNDRATNHNVLNALLKVTEIDDDTEVTLREIIERSPVPTLKPVYVHSHIRDKMIEFNNRDIMKVSSFYQPIRRYEDPGIVDIHELENELGFAADHAHPRLRRLHLDPWNLLEHEDHPHDPEDEDLNDEELEQAEEEARIEREREEQEREDAERMRRDIERIEAEIQDRAGIEELEHLRHLEENPG